MRLALRDVGMAVLQLRYYPDPALTRPSDPVEVVDEAIVELVENMAETMYVERGVGLAAPQVGINKRILVMDCGDPDGGSALIAFINPQIVSAEGTIVWEEGCLSFPGLTVEVERSETVRVRALGVAGKPFEALLSGLPAVCAQHEIDHLDGLTLFDRVSGLKKQQAQGRWKRLRAELDEQLAAQP